MKIRDRERNEDPHVSIMFKNKTWRMNLRTQEIMDTSPPAKEVPSKLLKEIKKEKNMNQLIAAWNKMYPENKV